MDANTQGRITPRSPGLFALVKGIALWGYRHLGRTLVEPTIERIVRIKQENPEAVALYVSLHRSLWETTGIPAALHSAELPIPYVVMGDNLIRGNFFQRLVRKSGGIIVRRPISRSDILTSARDFLGQIGTHLRSGIDIMVFPEATRTSIPKLGRYGDFFATTFEAVLGYERGRRERSGDRRECYIVPCNVDYSNVREAESLVRVRGKKPQTLHVFDSLKMLRKIGDVHISFGQPIRVGDHLDWNRQDLAGYTRERCLELVRILPVNVVAAALCEEVAAGRIDRESLLERITGIVGRLQPHADRFTGFTADTPPDEILGAASKINSTFRSPAAERLPLFRLYRDYISHYLPAAESPKE